MQPAVVELVFQAYAGRSRGPVRPPLPAHARLPRPHEELGGSRSMQQLTAPQPDFVQHRHNYHARGLILACTTHELQTDTSPCCDSLAATRISPEKTDSLTRFLNTACSLAVLPESPDYMVRASYKGRGCV